jgi:hypothetical protein
MWEPGPVGLDGLEDEVEGIAFLHDAGARNAQHACGEKLSVFPLVAETDLAPLHGRSSPSLCRSVGRFDPFMLQKGEQVLPVFQQSSSHAGHVAVGARLVVFQATVHSRPDWHRSSDKGLPVNMSVLERVPQPEHPTHFREHPLRELHPVRTSAGVLDTSNVPNDVGPAQLSEALMVCPVHSEHVGADNAVEDLAEQGSEDLCTPRRLHRVIHCGCPHRWNRDTEACSSFHSIRAGHLRSDRPSPGKPVVVLSLYTGLTAGFALLGLLLRCWFGPCLRPIGGRRLGGIGRVGGEPRNDVLELCCLLPESLHCGTLFQLELDDSVLGSACDGSGFFTRHGGGYSAMKSPSQAESEIRRDMARLRSTIESRHPQHPQKRAGIGCRPVNDYQSPVSPDRHI